MTTIDDDTNPTAAEMIWWEAGGHPPWKRVWRDGVDVTDQDPSTWPAIWQPDVDVRSNRHARSPRRQVP